MPCKSGLVCHVLKMKVREALFLLQLLLPLPLLLLLLLQLLLQLLLFLLQLLLPLPLLTITTAATIALLGVRFSPVKHIAAKRLSVTSNPLLHEHYALFLDLFTNPFALLNRSSCAPLRMSANRRPFRQSVPAPRVLLCQFFGQSHIPSLQSTPPKVTLKTPKVRHEQ